MVLISVDLPQPFGPKMHTCSPHAISRSMPWRAARSPRITLTRLKESRGARVEFILGSIAWNASAPRGANHSVILTERGFHASVHGRRKNGRWRGLSGQEPVKRSSYLILKQPAQTGPKNKKEVKTASLSPPGVGGVLHDNTLCGSAACPARQVCGLTRDCFCNSLGDSPPKSLSFCG